MGKDVVFIFYGCRLARRLQERKMDEAGEGPIKKNTNTEILLTAWDKYDNLLSSK
jgi:hypothetical protein